MSGRPSQLPAAHRHCERGRQKAKISTRWPGRKCAGGPGPLAVPRRDGVPAPAFPAGPARSTGGCGSVTSTWAAALGCWPPAGRRPPSPRSCLPSAMGGPTGCGPGRRAPAATHAATRWVFASLHSQPLEAAAIRAEIRHRLKSPRHPADAAPARPGPDDPGHRPPPAGRADGAVTDAPVAEGIMRVLVVGAGVIGTVYGAHLSAAGHAISVLSLPPRARQLARDGMTAHDVLGGGRASARVRVHPGHGGRPVRPRSRRRAQ